MAFTLSSLIDGAETQHIARSALLASIAAYLAYWTGIYIYCITLHPLAKFPGPSLAAVSFWYEFYYDLWPHQHRYLWMIEELHRKYGPIVRINPIHIHIHDSEYFDDIYAGGRRKRDRDTWYMHASESGTMSWSLLQTMDHDLHRTRRAALNPFFSKRGISQLQAMIIEKIDRLAGRFSDAHRKGEVLNLTYAMTALTMDVISSYALGTDMGNLKREDWGSNWLEGFKMVGKIRPMGRQFPWITNLALQALSPDFVALLSKDTANIARKLKYPMDMIKAAVEDRENGKGEEKTEKLSANKRTIFQGIIDSDLPPSEKTPGRLNAEAGLVLGAGTETTARNLSVVVFYLLSNPDCLAKLREELKTVMPTPDANVPISDLEALPYFSAVITDGLRLAHGASSRLPRIPTEENLVYKEWVIPAGTPVMQSLYLHHMNPDIFPEPAKFNPQRWIDDPKLKRYLMVWGQGSRYCIGMNLATAELYFTISRILMRFDVELYDTIKERDVDVSHDCSIGVSRLDSPGMRIKITKDMLA